RVINAPVSEVLIGHPFDSQHVIHSLSDGHGNAHEIDCLLVGSCTAILRIIQTTPKSDKMPFSRYVLEGQSHGVTSFFLSALLIRTQRDFRHLAPHAAQTTSDGSGHANRACAPQAQVPPLSRAQTLRRADSKTSLCPM